MFHEDEAWSLTLREEHRLRVSEDNIRTYVFLIAS
jgi:hypothetical protein